MPKRTVERYIDKTLEHRLERVGQEKHLKQAAVWLFALHEANLFGLPYRIFVCLLGLVIVMLSVTGVYIWWKKWRARKSKKQHDAAKQLPI